MTTRTAALSVAILLCLAPAAHAEMVELAWGDGGRFERHATVRTGKFLEICGDLAKGQSVRWQYAAEAPLDFNIHYHVGDAVHYPEKRDAAGAAEGTLSVPADQGYCWMWTNKTLRPVGVQVTLTRN